jgi:hypothetical protein
MPQTADGAAPHASSAPCTNGAQTCTRFLSRCVLSSRFGMTVVVRARPSRPRVCTPRLAKHAVYGGPSAAKRALGTVQMTSPTAASSYQQQMRELRRTLMAQVLVRAPSSMCAFTPVARCV